MLVLMDHSKWRANRKEHEKRNNTIGTFVLKVVYTERKILSHMKSLIALQNKLGQCAKNQNCGFIRTYGSQISHLLIHLISVTFVL